MKTIKLFVMILLVSEMAFTYCKSEGEEKNIPRLELIKNESPEHIFEYTLIVSAKNWKTVNCTERYIDIPIREISENILEEGLVMIYMIEGDKYLALPFNYYQVRRILSFQPSFEPGHAYISIYGNFIMNISAKYVFKILIISSEIVKKNTTINWKNYTPINKKISKKNPQSK